MAIENDRGGVSTDDRQLIYALTGMSHTNIRHIERMVEGSPGRTPGKAALQNVLTRFDSLKNSWARLLESHTCELVYAYELELDPTVIGYYTQVPCIGVKRTLANGRRHVSSARLDFLVFRNSAVELIECKPESWLRTESEKAPNSWQRLDDRWRHVAYEMFAQEREIGFSIWSPPESAGVYLQNLEAIYGRLRAGINERDQSLVGRVVDRLRARPMSIIELCDEFEGFDGRLALWMLGKSLAFGPLKSTSVEMMDLFTLCADRQQAQVIDELGLDVAHQTYAQDGPTHAIFVASATDIEKSRQRLSRIDAIEKGESPQTDRMRELALHVAKAVALGQSPLEACLTQYSQSGNRIPRLCEEQELAAATVITKLWNTGRVKTPNELYREYEKECQRRGVEASSRTSLYVRIRRELPTKHALATGGMRAYQAIRPATDPRRRSLPPIGYGHTMHVDSSDLDVRTAPNLAKLMPALKAKFYIGVDGATELPMAHALIFGPARTDGLAILVREYVRRHGCLPQLIHLDRGPENRSWWMEALADGYHLTLRISPTSGSAWNSQAESVIKRINQQVAHHLPGSTLPDQMGRKVDGRFKSYRNVKTSFEEVRQQFLAFVYEDLPNTTGQDGATPLEKRDEVLATFGDFGIPCEYNEDLLLSTSIEVDIKKNIDDRRGVRTEEGYFSSDELIHALRFHDPEQILSDCEDPTILRVRIGGTWIKAFHKHVQSMALLTPAQKLFNLLYAPIRRAHVRQRKEVIARARYDRIELAKFADTVQKGQQVEAQHVIEPVNQENVLPSDDKHDRRKAMWDDLGLYDERGASL